MFHYPSDKKSVEKYEYIYLKLKTRLYANYRNIISKEVIDDLISNVFLKPEKNVCKALEYSKNLDHATNILFIYIKKHLKQKFWNQKRRRTIIYDYNVLKNIEYQPQKTNKGKIWEELITLEKV